MSQSGVVVAEGTPLHARLASLATEARMVFLAGLPGTGKSLLVHQLAHLAHARARAVHLLRWDTARPAVEATPAAARYPINAGVTHGMVRLAVGLWARQALVAWHSRHPEPAHLLIGETPLVGHRLIELAHPANDAAEPLLTARHTHFVIPVPSRELRGFLESERARRMETPHHPQEREDAPPDVLRDLWRELVRVAGVLGVIPTPPPSDPTPSYDPDLYEGVYRRLLRHRRAERLDLDTVLPTSQLSAYELAVPHREVIPTSEDATRAIREVERRYPDPAAAESALARWYG